MIYLTYDPYQGVAYRDGEVDTYIDSIVDSLEAARDHNMQIDVHITYATDNILEAFRLAVHQRRIPFDVVQILWQREDDLAQINIDPNGNLEEWPEGFADYTMKKISQLIDW